MQKMPHFPDYDIIVIGAGASGLLAAGRAGELGARVLLLEKMKQPGRKLMITGKGRCNITNDDGLDDFISHILPDGRFLISAFSRFFSADIISLLNQYEIETVLERGGRYFPAGKRSVDVVNALIRWNTGHHVEIRCGMRVTGLIIQQGSVKGVTTEKGSFSGSSVIVCTGGKSYPATGSAGDGYHFAETAGHTIIPVRQSLVPVTVSGEIPRKLNGLTLKNVKVSVFSVGKKCKEESGEMMFMPFGLSGPVILTLSRLIVDEFRSGKSIDISIDLKPALDEKKLDARLIRDLNASGRQNLSKIFRSWLPLRLIPVFLEILSLDPEKKGHQVTGADRNQILKLMKNWSFRVSGIRPFKEAIITAGGIRTDEINPKTMESKLVRNLYFAGEVLDLDADTGGYNLQIAWSTGWIAGNSAAHQEHPPPS
jgi:predicted Rossmann fold flavoprotein